MTDRPQRLADLHDRPLWGLWRLESGPEGNPTKRPYNPHTGQLAAVDDPHTWGTYAQAEAALERGAYNGLALLVTAPLVFVDLDNALGPRGEPKPWAAPILARFAGTYTEHSVSGRGAHVLGLGRKPGPRCKKRLGDGEVELYDGGRFCALTGDLYNGCGPALADISTQLAALYRELWPEPERAAAPEPTPTHAALADDHLLALARKAQNGAKFRALYDDGDVSAYGGDDSAADMGLVCMLGFWARRDTAQMDRLFRASALMRPKWDERRGDRTYGQRTLDAAITSCVEVYTPRGDTERPQLDAGENRLEIISAQAWAAIAAMNQPPYLFQHAGGAVRLELETGEPLLVELNADRLRYEAARAADWMLARHVGENIIKAAAKPPMGVVHDMLAYPAQALPLPGLDRIVRAPVFAPDGTLQASPGYHAAGRVYLALTPGLEVQPVPEAPTPEELAAAVAMIDDLLADFPLVGDADRAHAYALLLLPFVRDLIAGPTPLHLIEAPQAGTGKGLLATALLAPSMGASFGTLSAAGDEEEWRKRITTVLQRGASAVLIDNVQTTLASGELSRALTTLWWDDRRLGANEMFSLRVRCAWVATGNNPMLSTEIARRTIRIRLDAKIDQPWRRAPASFRHPALLSYVQERRGEIIGAALTIAQAWLAAGRPDAVTPPLGSYEDWARVLGGILAHAGIRGFLSNLDELYERADSEGAAWRRFVGLWWDRYAGDAVGVGDLFTLARDDAELDFGAAVTERGQRTVFGKMLAAKEDVVLGGYRIVKAPAYKRLARYRLAQAYTEDVHGVLGVLGAHSAPAVISSSQSGAGGKCTPSTPSTPSELADVCCVCGADVASYGADGRAYCEEHMPRR